MAKIASVIEYEGDKNTLIYKHPCEDFNALSQLIVHESQEAIFFMNGEALDTFGPGRHTLETQNIPKVGKLLNRTTGGETPFHCQVYFVNKTVQMDLKWGTDSKVRYIDPDSGLPLEIGASGSLNLQVENARKLLIKLVGTMKGIAWDNEDESFTKSLLMSFRPLISTAVKSNLTTAIKNLNINLLEVDEHLTELSEVLKDKVEPGFEEYGLVIPQFYLTTVVLPEDDHNFRRIRELHTIALQKRMAEAQAEVRKAQAKAEADVVAAAREIELEKQTTQTEVLKREAERTVIEAEAKANAQKLEGFAQAEVMRAQGYNQKDIIEAEVQKAYAEGIGNMGSNGGSAGGGIASDMMSMMAGMKVAGTMMDKMDGMFGASSGETMLKEKNLETVNCPNCGTAVPAGSKFCLSCGEKIEIVPEGMVVCPDCGKTVQKGKFCLECGHKFISVCPSCGKELPEGSKFCLECGAKI